MKKNKNNPRAHPGIIDWRFNLGGGCRFGFRGCDPLTTGPDPESSEPDPDCQSTSVHRLPPHLVSTIQPHLMRLPRTPPLGWLGWGDENEAKDCPSDVES
jgi:hypothetical protein